MENHTRGTYCEGLSDFEPTEQDRKDLAESFSPKKHSVYVPGVGYVSQAYADLRLALRDLVSALGTDNVSGHILDENTGRVRIIIEGLNQAQIVKQKHEIAGKVREIFPGLKLLNSRVRNHSIWCCYFSDGNFNTYACGFEFEMPKA